MKRFEKTAAILLTVLLGFSTMASPGATAANVVNQQQLPIIAQVQTEDESAVRLNPRYTNISSIASGLTISSLGRAACTGTATMRNDYDGTLTMTLEKLNDNDRWEEVTSWSTEFSGPEVVMLDRGYYVRKGYSYQVVTNVEIRDGSKVIESVSIFSPIKTY